MGMSPNPGEANALRDRFTCAKCSITPVILKAVANDGSVTVTFKCHGETETKTFQVSDIRLKTRDVFTDEAPEDLSGFVEHRNR